MLLGISASQHPEMARALLVRSITQLTFYVFDTYFSKTWMSRLSLTLRPSTNRLCYGS